MCVFFLLQPCSEIGFKCFQTNRLKFVVSSHFQNTNFTDKHLCGKVTLCNKEVPEIHYLLNPESGGELKSLLLYLAQHWPPIDFQRTVQFTSIHIHYTLDSTLYFLSRKLANSHVKLVSCYIRYTSSITSTNVISRERSLTPDSTLIGFISYLLLF